MSQDNGYPDQGSRVIEEEPDGWEYIADVRAWEAFRNMLRGFGVSLQEAGRRKVNFTSPKRINMKALKEKGLLWSYSVAKVKRVKELVEVG